MRPLPRLVLLLALGALSAEAAPSLLHPPRTLPPPAPQSPRAEEIRFTGEDGALLQGWLFRAAPGVPAKGLLVYLHGLGDNRRSGVGLAQRYTPQGWDVLTYDQRAHGLSGGAACTYGVKERRDLSHALDAVGATRAVVFGSSMGAATALQAAAVEPRIVAVIAQSPYGSLRQVAHERAPGVASAKVDEKLRLAGESGGFDVDDASPLALAERIKVPVLLVHGTDDVEVRAEHSRLLDRALTCPHRLVLVPGAGHNDVLARSEAWVEIETFLGELAPPAQGRVTAQPRK